MAKESAPAKSAETRIEGAINDVAIKGMVGGFGVGPFPQSSARSVRTFRCF
jgi:hypothetical protein